MLAADRDNIGTAVRVAHFTPWCPRACAEFDAARAAALEALAPILAKFPMKRPRPLRVPVDSAAYQRARERFANHRRGSK